MVFYDTPGILNDCAVPAGINQMNIIATGADGGERGPARFGGAGGSVSAAFNVTPGDHIRVIIGEAGEDGFHAAGGSGGNADLAGSGGGINSGGSGCDQCADGVNGLGTQASNTAMAQAGTNSGATQGSGGVGYGGAGAGNYYTPGGAQPCHQVLELIRLP